MTDQPKTEKGGTTDHDHETVRLPLLQSLLKSWTGPEYGLGEIAQATPWAAAIFAIQVLKGAAPIIIVVGIGIYGASFIERSIVESRNSALTLITETRKEARNDLDNQIKAFNDMTTATSAQIANIAKMQDLQQQVSSQLNAATDARLAAQKAEQDALTKKREAEDQVRSLEDQVKFLNDKANSLQEQVQAALLATQHVVPVDVQERKVKLNKFVRQVATAGKKDQLDAIAKSLQLPIVSDPKEERNNILLEVDKRVVDSNSMDELAKLLHDTTGQDF